MNKDHDYQKMITGILNLNTSDIETINVYEEANNPVIYVTLKRKKVQYALTALHKCTDWMASMQEKSS